MVSIDQQGFSQGPGWSFALELLKNVELPNPVSGFGIQAEEVSKRALVKQPVSIDGWGSTGTGAVSSPGFAVFHLPQNLALHV